MKMCSFDRTAMVCAAVGLGLVLLTGLNGVRAQSVDQTAKVEEIALWPGTAPGSENASASERIVTEKGDRSISAIARPTLTAFFASQPNGAAIMVLPGGGYSKTVIDKEGVEIARWLNTLGIDAFVLKYRLPDEGHNPGRDVALQDAQRALRLIRSGMVGADHLVDPKRIGVMGFSAGGHLSSVLGVYFDKPVYAPLDAADALSARPDFMVLGYAWAPRANEVPGGPSQVSAFAASYLIESAVSDKTPPAFVFAGNRDEKVSYMHSVRIANALQKAGVPVELHIFSLAPHGFALRGKGEEKAWPKLCAAWLGRLGMIPAAPQ